ncbi:hypothetical protein [Nocardia sp. NPDC058480]|uniref:hypothetical protein n=1 Tax=Nocardia sp. NPDC058480 TaxID=3346522 RepID=UPI0036618057
MTAPSATERADDWRSRRDRNDGRVPALASFHPLDADHLAELIGQILDRDDLLIRVDLRGLQRDLQMQGVVGTALLDRLRNEYPKLSWDTCGPAVYAYPRDYAKRDEVFGETWQALGLTIDETDRHISAKGTVDGWDVVVHR